MLVPALRQDLRLIPQKNSNNKEWYVFDPLINRYHYLDNATLEILKYWKSGETVNTFIEILNEEGIEIPLAELLNLILFLKQHKLITADTSEQRSFLVSENKNNSSIKKISKAYIFYRIHLWNPDNWLGKNLWLAKKFVSSYLRYPIYFLFAFGLNNYFSGRINFEDNSYYLFSAEAITFLAISLVFLKVIHEFAHAFTLKFYQAKVPSMGVTFIFCFPLLFTDANANWELTKRQRLNVNMAGMIAEIHIGMLAFFIWTIVDPGALSDIALSLFVASFVTSILINATPFLKFDGYFLLSDWFDFENLHERSANLAKHQIKSFMLNQSITKPEQLTQKTERNLILFAWLTWTYRLLMFTGIAIAVFILFPIKFIGLLVSTFILFQLVLLPFLKEILTYLPYLKNSLSSNKHALLSFYKPILVLSALLFLIFIPFKVNYQAYGVLTTLDYKDIYPSSNAKIEKLYIEDDQFFVENNTKLLSLSSPKNSFELNRLLELKTNLNNKLNTSLVTQEGLNEINLIKSEISEVNNSIQLLLSEVDKNQILAPFPGRLINKYQLHLNSWLPPDKPILSVVNKNSSIIVGFIKESELPILDQSESLIFVSNIFKIKPLNLKVLSIDRSPIESLDDFPQLSSDHGGRINTHSDEAKRAVFIPNSSYLKVLFSIEEDFDFIPDIETKGVVHIKAPEGKSLFSRFSKALYSRISTIF